MDDWRSFDRVAEVYERVEAPHVADPARDLLQLVEAREGERLLDVGAGTGVVAGVAAGEGVTAVGVDPSLGMLAIARREHPSLPVAAAEAIDLPFRDGSFDAVVGSFVLASFLKVETALFDLIRVTRPAGRLAFSTWADGRDSFTNAWLELVDQVVPSSMLEPSLASAYPNRDRFRRREALEETLIDAGLKHVRTEQVSYEWRYARDDYVDALTIGATGRFVRQMLGEGRWAAFMDRVRAAFAERFPDPLHDRRDVLLSLGVKE